MNRVLPAGTFDGRALRAGTRTGRRAALAAATLALAVAAVAVTAAPAVAAEQPCPIAPGAVGAPTTVTCDFTGGVRQWTVPPGVTEATFDLHGSQGGTSQNAAGGLGARVQATLAVTPGDVYEIRVGGVGGQAFSCNNEGPGGWNGGGKAATFCDPSWMYRYQGFGGGGATDVRLGGSALADRLLIAAGGGGSAHRHGGDGGAGGGPDGLDGGVAAGGAFGRGATQLAGGAGAVVVAPGGASGTDGALGVGGTGGAGATSGAGGGGGGLHGGGGGGVFPCVGTCGGDGGGGGGSSYGPPGTTFTAGARSGAGRAQISYTTVHPAPTCQSSSGETGGGRPLTVTLACADASAALTREVVAGPGKGTLGPIDPVTGDAVYTPAAGQSGTDEIRFRADGVNGPSATATVTITLHPPPACEPVTPGTGHDTPVTVTLSCVEADGQPMTYAIADEPSHGTLMPIDQANATVRYEPDTGFAGRDTFTYTATSENGTSVARTVEVSVDPLPPVCEARTATTGAVTSLAITLACAGTAGFANTYAVVVQPTNGAITSIDAATGALTYVPAVGYTGPDMFTYRATNAGGASSTVPVVVNVTAPPAPSCTALTRDVAANGSLPIALSCTSTDGFAMTFATVEQPEHGTLSALDAAAGTVTYTPAVGYHGPDSFTYRARNVSGNSAQATVTIAVDAPPAPACSPAHATIGEGTASVVVRLDCSGAVGFPIAYAVDAEPQHGTLSELDEEAGTVRYTPAEGFDGSDTFAFTGTNAGGSSAPAEAQMTVLAPPQFDGAPGEGGVVTDARPSLTFSGGTALDGFECRVDGGAWSACASPFMVPAVLERGAHAVSVRARGGDGERSRAVTSSFVVDGVTETVLPGGTVGSDVGGRGPGAGNPLEVAVTHPAGGRVTLRALAAGAVGAPSGHELLGHAFEIGAPAAPDAGRPLRIELRLDAALVPAGVGLDALVPLRDGVAIGAACTVPDLLGPAPCIASRRQEGSAIALVVLTDHASTWAVGRVLPTPGGGGGDTPPGGGGERPGGEQPAPVPGNRFAFPRVSVTRAGGLTARFAFPRAGRAVLVGTARKARSPFTSAGTLNRRGETARQALFTARTVRSPRARTVTVQLAPTKRGRALLRRDGRLAARLWVSFAPTGGTARAASRAVLVTLRLPRR